MRFHLDVDNVRLKRPVKIVPCPVHLGTASKVQGRATVIHTLDPKSTIFGPRDALWSDQCRISRCVLPSYSCHTVCVEAQVTAVAMQLSWEDHFLNAM